MEEPQILFTARPSLRRAFFFGFIYAGLVLFGRVVTDLDPRFNPIWWLAFTLLLGLLFIVFLRRWTTNYIVTSDEVKCVRGIIAREFVVVPLVSVTNAAANQSVLDRILGIVNLSLDTAGGDAKEIVFARILRREAELAARIIREQTKKATLGSSSQIQQANGARAQGY